MLSEKLKLVFQNEGIVTIIAQGKDFPHAVNTWNSYVELKDDYLIIPVAGMNTMEAILNNNNKVLVTVGSRDVEGLHGAGAGFNINGVANIKSDGDEYTDIKNKFVWARAMMKIDINDYYQTT